jgi:FtsH-binding integral membrane protein
VHETIDVIRRVLLVILLIGLVGTATELLLLKHHEDPAQFIPLVLIGMAFAALGWHALDQQRTSLRVVQATMVLFVLAGVLGMSLHYRANVAFQREVDPAVSGRALLVKALMAKTPPALAPGSMSQLGLIGLAYAYRYPTRRGRGHITRAAARPGTSGGDA